MFYTLTNSKGGVGTTSTATVFAMWLSRTVKSHDTYVIDCDGQSDIAKGLNLHESEGTYNLFDAGEAEAFEVTSDEGTLNVITSTRNSIEAVQDIIAARIKMNPKATSTTAERLRKNQAFANANVVIDTAKSGLLREVALRAADVIILPTALDAYSAPNTLSMINDLCEAGLRENVKIVVLPMFIAKNRATTQGQVIDMLKEAIGDRARIYTKGIPASVALDNAAWNGRTIYESAKCRPLLAAYEDFFVWLHSL